MTISVQGVQKSCGPVVVDSHAHLDKPVIVLCDYSFFSDTQMDNRHLVTRKIGRIPTKKPLRQRASRCHRSKGCNNKKTNGLAITPLIHDPDFFQEVEAAEQPSLRNR